MFVQRLADAADDARYDSYGERTDAHAGAATAAGEPVLSTFAECQQRWHPWRRRYDLFLRDPPRRVLQPVSEPVADAAPEPADGYSQVAAIDGGLLAWHFALAGADGAERASVSRRWGGLGREVFTDTGAYFVRFGPPPEVDESGAVVRVPRPDMSVEERALALATAVTIDFDYFSRHSSGGCVGLCPVGTRTLTRLAGAGASGCLPCSRCSSEPVGGFALAPSTVLLCCYMHNAHDRFPGHDAQDPELRNTQTALNLRAIFATRAWPARGAAPTHVDPHEKY
jgi:hypothetical protein